MAQTKATASLDQTRGQSKAEPDVAASISGTVDAVSEQAMGRLKYKVADGALQRCRFSENSLQKGMARVGEPMGFGVTTEPQIVR